MKATRVYSIRTWSRIYGRHGISVADARSFKRAGPMLSLKKNTGRGAGSLRLRGFGYAVVIYRFPKRANGA